MKKPYSDESVRKYTDMLLMHCIQYVPCWIHPIHITILGFCIGITVLLWIPLGEYGVALFVVCCNRIFDALDGMLARERNQKTMAGSFLDIILDFIFYSSVPIAYALANPYQNALIASIVVFSFMVTGGTFLAFAIFAEKLTLQSGTYGTKSLYYMGGLVEGTETIIFLLSILLFPQYFVIIAGVFSATCFITGGARIVNGYMLLRNFDTQEHL